MALLNSGGIGARTDFHQRGAGEIPAPAIGLARMKRAGFRSQRKGLVKAQEGRRKQLTRHHRASPAGHRDLLCTEPPPLMCSASKSKPACQNQALAPRAAHRMLRGIPYTGRDPGAIPCSGPPGRPPMMAAEPMPPGHAPKNGAKPALGPSVPLAWRGALLAHGFCHLVQLQHHCFNQAHHPLFSL